MLLLLGPAGAMAEPVPWNDLSSWDDLKPVAEGNGARLLRWLTENSSLADVSRVSGLVRKLSKPEAFQLVGAYMQLDGAARHGRLLAGLTQRPAAGDAGVFEVTYRVLKTRHDYLARLGSDVWAHTFSNQAPPLPELPVGRTRQLKLSFDFSPARKMLALLSRGEQDPTVIRNALTGPEYDALLEHRGQSFYRMPLTWEQLVQNVALAGSDEPLPALYREANPTAFLDLGDVKRNLAAYGALIDRLEAAREAILHDVEAGLLPYMPAGLELERHVAFFFCSGTDGWARDSLAGVDLEYFKDNYPRLRRLLIHETYHAAQSAARPEQKDKTLAETIPKQRFEAMLEALYSEGTATFVAPPKSLTDEQRLKMIQSARNLVGDLEQQAFRAETPDPAVSRDIYSEGVRGAGPFYWLGAAMAKAIVDREGPAGLGRVLQGGHKAFFRAYGQTVDVSKSEPLLSASMLARVTGE